MDLKLLRKVHNLEQTVALLRKDLRKVHNLEQTVAILRKDMVSESSRSVIITLDSCNELGNNITKMLEDSLNGMNIEFRRFKNNEVNVFPTKSVRQKNVYIVASGSNIGGNVNDNLMTMYSLIRSCRDASAKEITILCAYLPYCRSDKKDKSRMPIMAKLICDFFEVAGANRIITVDLHAAQIQGFFDGSFDNLYAINYLINAVIKDYNMEDMILVSPDAGGFKRIENWGKKTGCEYTFMIKSRDHDKISTIMEQKLVDKIDLNGKVVIIVDDIFDTGSTMCNGAKILRENGAAKVIAIVTHGVFSSNAFENIAKDDLDAIYVTNSLPQNDNMIKSSKIKVVDISALCSDAILTCVNGTSMSALFV